MTFDDAKDDPIFAAKILALAIAAAKLDEGRRERRFYILGTLMERAGLSRDDLARWRELIEAGRPQDVLGIEGEALA